MFKLKQLDVPTIATILESYSKILGGRNVKFLVPEEILEDWIEDDVGYMEYRIGSKFNTESKLVFQKDNYQNVIVIFRENFDPINRTVNNEYYRNMLIEKEKFYQELIRRLDS